MAVQRIVILGAGTAGLIAALTLRKKVPSIAVEVLRSPEIGVIGVGEGTNVTFPDHMHSTLGVPMERLFELMEPTWKLGIRFLWGPQPDFFYPFATEYSGHFPEVSRTNAAHLRPQDRWIGPISALMAHDRVFFRRADGRPQLHNYLAYHLENVKLVAGLEVLCREAGAVITDGRMAGAEQNGDTISALVLEDGRRLTADLFIDASGFRSELLGRVLQEPMVSYGRSLFCDRAVIGGWERGAEPILPYTIAETMDAGWAWQIEHERFINRGYVYASGSLSDDAAAAELLRKNPKIPENRVRVVKFTTGRRARSWVGNVIGLGNAAGFVEPLEATAIQVICRQSTMLGGALTETDCSPGPPMREMYNRMIAREWDDIRDFLAVHYRFNTRLDTPFWRAARAGVDLAGAAELVDFYRTHGPSLLPQGVFTWSGSPFGMEGYLAILSGQRVPVERRWQPPAAETQAWESRIRSYGDAAKCACTTEEAFAAFRQVA